jgi:hypothetical protein
LATYQALTTAVSDDFCKYDTKVLLGLICFPNISGADLSTFSTAIDVG